MVEGDKSDDQIPTNDKETSRVDNWMPGACQIYHPLGTSLPQLTANPSRSGGENVIDKN